MSTRNNKTKLLINFKTQPVTNRFLKKKNIKKKLFELKLIQEINTGLIKLEKPFPFKEIKSRFDWITYSEPEDHLSKIVNDILKSTRDKKIKLNIGGISYKDDSTLSLLRRKGHKIWRLNLQKDLNLDYSCGVESIQKSIENLNHSKIINKYGKSDVLIIRHIWEHVYNQEKFIKNLKKILSKDGILLFEIPDCSNLIKKCIYTMVWEEHLFYYTPKTFFESLNNQQLSILNAKKIIYPYEDVLYAIAKPSKKITNTTTILSNKLKNEIINATNYSKQFFITKNKIRNFLLKHKKKGKIALFGVGHMSISYLSFFNLFKIIDYLVDNNKKKIGLYTPIGDIQIYGTEILISKNIKICLLGMNPLNHKSIIKKNKKFINNGGKFFSIFNNDF